MKLCIKASNNLEPNPKVLVMWMKYPFGYDTSILALKKKNSGKRTCDIYDKKKKKYTSLSKQKYFHEKKNTQAGNV